MSLEDLKVQIKTNNFSNLYLFYGEEDYIKKSYFDKIIKMNLTGGFEGFNFILFSEKGFSSDDVIDAVDSYPVMSEKKIVVFKDVEFDKLKDDVYKTILSSLNDLPDYIILIIYFSRDEKLVTGKKVNDIIKLVSKKGVAVKAEAPKSRELNTWIKNKFEEQGKQIGQREIERLLFLSDNDMISLGIEIDKLCCYVESDKINTADIEKIVVKSADAKGYQLTDALLKSDGEKTFFILKELSEQKLEGTYILAIIQKAFISCVSIKLLMENKQNPVNFASKIGLRDFVVRNYSNMLKYISLKKLERIVALCLESDILLKSSRVDNEEIIYNLINKILILCKGGRAS